MSCEAARIKFQNNLRQLLFFLYSRMTSFCEMIETDQFFLSAEIRVLSQSDAIIITLNLLSALSSLFDPN